MPDPRPVSPDSVEPLGRDEAITVRHLNGQTSSVTFVSVDGDKLNRITVRWGMAGEYDVNLFTGQLLGGKPRKKASVWRVIPEDLARIHATAKRRERERNAQKKQTNR